MDIKGHRVDAVLVEEASDIAREFYLSFLVDRAARTFTSICSVQGGMEIEEVAHTSPAAVAQIVVDPLDRGGRTRRRPRSCPPAGCRPRPSRAPLRPPSGCGPCSPTRTRRSSRSTR